MNTVLVNGRVFRGAALNRLRSAAGRNGLLVVPAEEELAFLHPLPVERLWGVGQATSEKLRRRGITTVGEVARLPEAALVFMLGRAAGRQLHALAHNRDPRPVTRTASRSSPGAGRPARPADRGG